MQTTKARGLCAAFSLALLIFLASAANAANWIDSADVSWYKEGQTEFTISTERQLAGLAKLVNDGNTFGIRRCGWTRTSASLRGSGRLSVPVHRLALWR